jgi:hypothetical protein
MKAVFKVIAMLLSLALIIGCSSTAKVSEEPMPQEIKLETAEPAVQAPEALSYSQALGIAGMTATFDEQTITISLPEGTDEEAIALVRESFIANNPVLMYKLGECSYAIEDGNLTVHASNSLSLEDAKLAASSIDSEAQAFIDSLASSQATLDLGDSLMTFSLKDKVLSIEYSGYVKADMLQQALYDFSQASSIEIDSFELTSSTAVARLGVRLFKDEAQGLFDALVQELARLFKEPDPQTFYSILVFDGDFLVFLMQKADMSIIYTRADQVPILLDLIGQLALQEPDLAAKLEPCTLSDDGESLKLTTQRNIDLETASLVSSKLFDILYSYKSPIEETSPVSEPTLEPEPASKAPEPAVETETAPVLEPVVEPEHEAPIQVLADEPEPVQEPAVETEPAEPVAEPVVVLEPEAPVQVLAAEPEPVQEPAVETEPAAPASVEAPVQVEPVVEPEASVPQAAAEPESSAPASVEAPVQVEPVVEPEASVPQAAAEPESSAPASVEAPVQVEPVVEPEASVPQAAVEPESSAPAPVEAPVQVEPVVEPEASVPQAAAEPESSAPAPVEAPVQIEPVVEPVTSVPQPSVEPEPAPVIGPELEAHVPEKPALISKSFAFDERVFEFTFGPEGFEVKCPDELEPALQREMLAILKRMDLGLASPSVEEGRLVYSGKAADEAAMEGLVSSFEKAFRATIEQESFFAPIIDKPLKDNTISMLYTSKGVDIRAYAELQAAINEAGAFLALDAGPSFAQAAKDQWLDASIAGELACIVSYDAVQDDGQVVRIFDFDGYRMAVLSYSESLNALAAMARQRSDLVIVLDGDGLVQNQEGIDLVIGPDASIGLLKVIVDDTGAIALKKVDAAYKEDDAAMKKIDAIIAKASSIVVGTLSMDLPNDESLSRWTAMGKAVCFAASQALGADFSIIESRFISASLKKGDVTVSDIMKVLPLDLRVAASTVSSEEVYQAFEKAYSAYPQDYEGFLQSEIDVIFNPSAAPGSRILGLYLNGKLMPRQGESYSCIKVEDKGMRLRDALAENLDNPWTSQ